MSEYPRQICVFTSHTIEEPRARKHARAMARQYPRAEIVFIDAAARGRLIDLPGDLAGLPNIHRTTFEYWHREASVLRAGIDRLLNILARQTALATGIPLLDAFSPKARGILNQVLRLAPAADLYIGHNVDALPVIGALVGRSRAPLVFDSMEYYSDMGSGQSEDESKIIRLMEARLLGKFSLVLTSSEQIALALRDEYGVERTLTLENVPPATAIPKGTKLSGFNLYWRNSVLGVGARGLQDAIAALKLLPENVRLHLQGRLPGGDGSLRAEIRAAGLESRIEIHPPYPAGEAVLAAARYQVGLCLEQDVCRNHRLTVSNKLFDYFMGGLAVVVSDLPGLRGVVERAGGGLLYRPGDVASLAGALRTLYDDPQRVSSMAGSNRSFALRSGNEEAVMSMFTASIGRLLAKPSVAS